MSPAGRDGFKFPRCEEGSWVDLEVDDPSARKAIDAALARDEDSRELAPLVQQELELCSWRWPALEKWRAVFAARGECPAMWEEVLIHEPPQPGWSPDEMALRRSLPEDARAFARGIDGAFSLAERSRRLGWELARCESALEALRAGGAGVERASVRATLGAMGIKELRSLQRALGLKGARSKDELRDIILEGAKEEVIEARLDGAYFVLSELSTIRDGWGYYCSWVARLLVHTQASEAWLAERLHQWRQESVTHVQWDDTGNYHDTVCQELAGPTLALGDEQAGHVHFPGCRCVLLVTERANPFDESREPRQHEAEPRAVTRRKPASPKGGCLVAIVGLVSIAAVAAY